MLVFSVFVTGCHGFLPQMAQALIFDGLAHLLPGPHMYQRSVGATSGQNTLSHNILPWFFSLPMIQGIQWKRLHDIRGQLTPTLEKVKSSDLITFQNNLEHFSRALRIYCRCYPIWSPQLEVAIIIPILWVRKWRLRDDHWISPDHTSRKEQGCEVHELGLPSVISE